MNVESYLFFNGRCREAVAFYQKVLGAEVLMMIPFSESPDPSICPENGADKIMHATIKIGATTLMASDGNCEGTPEFKGFSLSIAPEDADEAHRIFNALAEGGTVHMALEKTFWAELFGMVEDQFGLSWMLNLESSECQSD